MLKDAAPGEQVKDDGATETELLEIPDAIPAILTENKRITPSDHWQDVRLLTFDIDEDIRIFPGDSLTIFPKNFPKDVQHVLNRLGWAEMADESLHFIMAGKKLSENEFHLRYKSDIFLTSETPTLRQLLTHSLDINAIPKRSFLEMMISFTQDLTEQERLQEFANPVFSDEFFDYATRPRRTIIEVLDDFPSCQLPWQYACHFFPPLRGRQYSICNGGSLARHQSDPSLQRVQLVIALVKYRTIIRKVRTGLCSRYVDTLPVGTRLNVWLNTNPMFYPQSAADPTRNILMIAAGTGVAPLRSLIWDRAQRELDFADRELTTSLGAHGHGQQQSISNGQFERARQGQKVLIFGSRNEDKDFFFRDEWLHVKQLKLQVLTAFSRDQVEKRYVQDVIREQGALVTDMIENQCALYVCGSSGRMPLAIKSAIVDALAKWSSSKSLMDNREACEAFVTGMEKQGRYIQETW